MTESAVDAGPVPNQRLALLLPPLAAVLVATLIVFFGIYQTTEVEGASMAPTLEAQDRLLVTRGYDDPARGDVVVVVVPGRDGYTETVVKRVAALEGDQVSVIGDLVYVNGQAAYAPDAVIGKEVLVEDELVVPAGSVYVLGDNRPVSYDSRFYGPVSRFRIEGRVVAVYTPVNRIQSVDGAPERD